MSPVIDLLYEYWIGPPRPEEWPDCLSHDPMKVHGEYCFSEGLRLGLLLAFEALFPETRA